MKQQAAAIESDGGNAGQVSKSDPLLDVVEVEVEFLGQVGLVGAASGGAQQVEGRSDAEVLEVLTVFGTQAREVIDRPVGGFESFGGRLGHGVQEVLAKVAGGIYNNLSEKQYYLVL